MNAERRKKRPEEEHQDTEIVADGYQPKAKPVKSGNMKVQCDQWGNTSLSKKKMGGGVSNKY